MRTSVLCLLLGGVLVLSACGGSGDVGPEPGASPTASADGSGPDPGDGDGDGAQGEPDPTLTGKAPGRAVTVTGVVRVSSEDRCTLLLPADGAPAWVLVGSTGATDDGRRVTVTGRADTGTTSRCQSGPVLVVTSVSDAP